jgi:O-antigen/teichoic acid export membrane protein
MSPFVRRVVAGLGANAFGQGTTIAIQVLSLPLFLQRWDLGTYGTWLMLSAIPSYLSMADVGMVTVAGNEMTMAMGRGDPARANRIFRGVLAIVSLICGALAVLLVPMFWLLPWTGMASGDETTALLALALAVLAAFFGGLADIVFKSTHRFALGTLLGNLARIAEWGGSLAGLFLGGTFAAVSLGALAARLAATLATIVVARRDEGREIRWGLAGARRADVLAMVRPAVSFMAFPFANALSLQGVTLLVGNIFGAGAVAAFNAYRTLARIAVQASSAFSVALWPEFSRMYGFSGAHAVGPIYRRAAILGAWLAVAASLSLYVCAPFLLRVWTQGKIGFDALSMGLMLAYGAISGLAQVPRVVLISTNLHEVLAKWSMALAIALLFLSDVLGRLLGIEGVTLAMLLIEAILAALVLVLVQRVVRNVPAPLGAPT